MTQPPTPTLQLFSCERLSARLTVKACGARYLKVRAATKGSADYTSACDQCPVGEHHARTGTLSPGVQTQTTATAATTTTTKETTTMGAPSEYTDDQKRAAVHRVLLGQERRADVGEALGVSAKSVSNWIARWGHEVAGDAMDAASGKVTPTAPKKPAKKAPTKAAPKPAAKPRTCPPHDWTDGPGLSVCVSCGAREGGDAPPLAPRAMTPETARIAREIIDECKRLAPELAASVRHIADRDTRRAVADAAWLLQEFAHG